MRGGAVSAVPATGNRGCLVQRAPTLFAGLARTFLCAISSGWSIGAGNTTTPGKQQLRFDSYNGRPRGVPRSPLAPGDDASQSESHPPLIPDVVFHRRLGSVRRT